MSSGPGVPKPLNRRHPQYAETADKKWCQWADALERAKQDLVGFAPNSDEFGLMKKKIAALDKFCFHAYCERETAAGRVNPASVTAAGSFYNPPCNMDLEAIKYAPPQLCALSTDPKQPLLAGHDHLEGPTANVSSESEIGQNKRKFPLQQTAKLHAAEDSDKEENDHASSVAVQQFVEHLSSSVCSILSDNSHEGGRFRTRLVEAIREYEGINAYKKAKVDRAQLIAEAECQGQVSGQASESAEWVLVGHVESSSSSSARNDGDNNDGDGKE